MAFTLTTTAFDDGGTIPRAWTCDGENLPPPLTWSGAPRGTAAYALIVDDPDAPGHTFTHCLLYDIPGTLTGLRHPLDGRTLPNDFGRPGYGGPCPPRGHGPHRYVFTLYAVDVPELALRGTSRKALDQALARHTLGHATLTGVYER